MNIFGLKVTVRKLSKVAEVFYLSYKICLSFH
jgi:hypothetical protein